MSHEHDGLIAWIFCVGGDVDDHVFEIPVLVAAFCVGSNEVLHKICGYVRHVTLHSTVALYLGYDVVDSFLVGLFVGD